ncbi:MAG: ArnT family glycosyltransferase [Candidatus Pacearchaeota archaeon]
MATSDNNFANFIDGLFSMDKTKLFLLIFFAFGLIIRIISAVNVSVSADDMHHVIHAIDFYKSGRLVTYDQSAGLWHALTSVFYSVFGVGQFTSRFLLVLFGSFTILLVYLLSKEFFPERVSLFAAFLTAIAPFHIKLTVGEMDIMAMFFVMLSMLLFVRGLKSDKKILFAFSGIAMGLALYTKVYPVLFIPSLLLYAIYYYKKNAKEIISKKNVRLLSIFVLAAVIFAIPVLVHNYLLFQEKGFLDLQFTRTFGLGKEISQEYYGWDHQFNAKNDWSGLVFGRSSNYGDLPTPTLWVALNYLRFGSPLVFYLGIAGIIFMFFYKRDRNYLVFLGLSLLFALPFLASIILLPKHYLFLELLLIPVTAFTLDSFITFMKAKYKLNLLSIIVVVLLIISFIVLGLTNTGTSPHFFGTSAVEQFLEFKASKIAEDSLIVSDSRIYRGQVHWLSYGRPYAEANSFIEFLNIQEDLPGKLVETKVYFIECVSDDCGWGTIKDQPELNASMERLTSLFAQRGILVNEIAEPFKDESFYPLQSSKLQSKFRVYLATVPLNPQVIDFASQPKEWFLYEIGYVHPDSQFDSFKRDTFFKKSLYNLARLIVLISMLFAVLCLLYIIYDIFGKSFKENSYTD